MIENNKIFTKKQLIITVLLGVFITGALVMAFVSDSGIKAVKKTFGSAANQSLTEIDISPLKAQEDIIVKIIDKINPAVVSVIATKDMPVVEQYYINPFGDDFNGLIPKELLPDIQVPQFRKKGVEKKQVSSGTGFFVSGDGLILTNRHVVEDETADYTVIMNNGKKIPAKVMARDRFQDISILKVDGRNFTFIPLGDSDNIKVGQTAIAIGNALGEFQNTVSVGVISGLRRTVTAAGALSGPEKLQSLIQTDAAINPGNSGGPLIDLNGKAIGINTAIASGAQNIGFALPINFAEKDIEDVKKFNRIKNPFLGVRYTIITAELKEKNKLSVDYGALITKGPEGESAISAGSPAEKAGLREGDIITEFGGKKIDTANTLADLISKKNVGDTVMLKILRKGKELKLYVVLDELKQ